MHMYNFDLLYETGEFSQQQAAISIGVYDGIHLGHKLVIDKTIECAQKQSDTKSVVVTFSQNPKTLLGRNPFNKPLMSDRQMYEALSALGVDCVVIIDFSPDFSKLTGEEFIERLCSMFKVKAIVVGENFRCGAKADTGVVELKQHLNKHAKGATLHVPPMYTLEDGTINSSTLVRSRLTQGDVSELPMLLGRNYSVDLGHIPSMNTGHSAVFAIDDIVQLLPPPGVYEGLLLTKSNDSLSVKVIIDESSFVIELGSSASKINRYEYVEFVKELT
ncbi:MAG: FAD synthetase family protein [Sphaerochaetaceae bacterium]|jgi:riboflavin kinase/FMN adenylyltransferase